MLGVQAQYRIGVKGLVREIFGPTPPQGIERDPLRLTLELYEAIERIFPEDASDEALQQAYAYEMLPKLDDMVSRTRECLQKRHLFPDVPEPVDDYMAESSRQSNGWPLNPSPEES